MSAVPDAPATTTSPQAVNTAPPMAPPAAEHHSHLMDAPHPEDPNDLSHNKWAISLAVIFGVLMSAIDSSVVNVAMPYIQGNLGATQQEITWISTAYMISVVILMPLTNWLATRFGRKRIYLTSLVLFTASSFMCGMSRTLPELIFWRCIQGFGAGTLQPLAQAMFREAFPPEEQGVAMGVFGFVVLAGPAIGPTLGGYITDNYNWPWIFFINLPIGVVGFLVALRVLVDPPYAHGTKRARVDASGIFLLAIGLSTLQTVLEQGQTDDWFDSPFICWFTVISTVALIGFIWRELTAEQPAVDLRVLKNIQFAAGTTIGALLGVGLFASLFLVPQFLQVLLGFTATQAGLTMMPRSLTMMFAMPLGGILYNKLGPRIMIISGLCMSIWTQLYLSHSTLDTGYDQMVGPLMLQGVGFGLVFVAMSTAALSTIERTRMTSATGLNNLLRQLGGSIGTSLVVTLLTRHTDMARADLVSNTSSTSPVFMERLSEFSAYFVQQGYSAAQAQSAALGLIYQTLQRQAATIAYDYIFFWIGAVFMLSLPFSLFLTGARKKAATAAAAPGEMAHVAID
jgi:DHA2 family multidrug resistance protein